MSGSDGRGDAKPPPALPRRTNVKPLTFDPVRSSGAAWRVQIGLVHRAAMLVRWVGGNHDDSTHTIFLVPPPPPVCTYNALPLGRHGYPEDSGRFPPTTPDWPMWPLGEERGQRWTMSRWRHCLTCGCVCSFFLFSVSRRCHLPNLLLVSMILMSMISMTIEKNEINSTRFKLS